MKLRIMESWLGRVRPIRDFLKIDLKPEDEGGETYKIPIKPLGKQKGGDEGRESR